MRLIDADIADVVIIYDKSNELTQVSAIREHIKRQKAFLDKFPTIDAVPVVRCWECKHRYTENCPMYFHDSYWHEGYEEYVDDYTDHTEDDYFCPKGERKEGAE